LLIKRINAKRGKMFKINDTVALDGPKYYGQKFTVKKINPTTYLVAEVGNPSRKIRASHSLVFAISDSELRHIIYEPITPHYVAGTVVIWKGSRTVSGIEPGGLAVVLVDRGTHVNIAKLGGFEDRYVKAQHSSIAAIPISTSRLAELSFILR
jgi:hypothetical protein